MRISQLDGVRALAILMVFSEHAFALKLGWAGVDLFFVLSGFLITRILRKDRESESFWSRFYIKRTARILPPLVLCLVMCALLFRLQLHYWWLAYVFFMADLAKALHPHSGGPLGILWSLAIEEHFYLVWPFAIRWMRRRQLLLLLVFILVAEPLLRGAVTPYLATPWVVYYGTPFRLDGLAMGSLLALLLEDGRAEARIRSLAAPVFFSGTLLYAILLLTFTNFRRPANSITFNSLGYTLTTLVAASLIAYTLLHEDSILTRILSLRVLTFLGTISYGIYLFHLVFIAKVRPTGHYYVDVILALPCLLLFSWLSFILYEHPINRWGHQLTKKLGALPRTSLRTTEHVIAVAE